MTDVKINQMVNIMDYAIRPGIFAVFSDYDWKNRTGILRYISDKISDVPHKLRRKYSNLCMVNTIPASDTVEYDIDE